MNTPDSCETQASTTDNTTDLGCTDVSKEVTTGTGVKKSMTWNWSCLSCLQFALIMAGYASTTTELPLAHCGILMMILLSNVVEFSSKLQSTAANS
jgi:hypothetical protein